MLQPNAGPPLPRSPVPQLPRSCPQDVRARRAASVLTARRVVFAGLVLATTLAADGARHPRARGERARRARHRAARAVPGDAALDRDRLLERRDRFRHHAFCARPRRGVVTPAAGRIRGDEPITASAALMTCIRNEPPQRVIRNLAPMLDGLVAAGVGARFHLYVLSDTSDPETAAAEEASFADLAAQWRDRIAITYRRRTEQHRLQGRQHPRLLRALGRPPRIRGHARRRQLHAGQRHPAHGAHHAGVAGARHPAGARRRHALDQRLRPDFPVRHAARHALLHHRQRLVAGRLRPLLGAQRDPPPRPVHGALPHAGAAADGVGPCSAAMCSATTRSRRR